MDRKKPLKIAILTGEQSGDQIGANLIDQLRAKKEVTIFAIPGQKMRQKKPISIFDQEELEVMGFSDVIKALPKLFRLFKLLTKKLLEIKPDIIVCIDYPTWHLKLAKRMRKKGFKGKIVQYVSPTIWAYKKKRLKLMEKVLDSVLCIFPFEIKAYQNSKLKAFYVGNPTLENLEEKKSVQTHIALFPGSRKSEIEMNLPLQLQTFKELHKKHPKYTLAISYASNSMKKLIEEKLKEKRIKAKLFAGLQQANRCKMAIATSGTINLELALRKVPTLVCYQISKFQYFIAKYLLNIQTKFFCIVNILLNKLFFPEFYGPNLDAKKMAQTAQNLLEEKNEKEFDRLKKTLTKKKASQTAAAKILQLYMSKI